MSFLDLAAKLIGEKKRWRTYKARTAKLPEPHRTAIGAVERYLMCSGAGPSDGALAATMFEDLADLFEQAVADGTSVRGVVGDDPVGFADAFVANYSDGGWLEKERSRLIAAIDDATGAVS